MYETTICDNPLSLYNAKLVSYAVSPRPYTGGFLSAPLSVFPVLLKGKTGLRSIALDLDFEGDTDEILTTNISNFTAMIQKSPVLFLPDGYYYTSALSGMSDPQKVAPWIMRASFTFLGVRHKELVTVIFSETSSFIVNGNSRTPAIIKIMPGIGTTEVNVNGINIRNMTGEVIIDGINKTVTRDGVNCFADTNLTEFPFFECGENSILIDGDATVEVSYYPIFI